MSVALQLVGLQCVRGARLLFGGVSASVNAGEMLRVRGENGSGKTSLLRMVCGLSAPDSGEVLWHGRRLAEARDEFNAQLAYLGHLPALKEDLSALENLQATGGLAGLMTVIKLAEAGKQVDLFSFQPVKRSHSVCAQGGINGAVNTKGEGDHPEIHFVDTVKGGDFLAHQPLAKGMCYAAPNIIYLLDRMGVPFTRTPEGMIDFPVNA